MAETEAAKSRPWVHLLEDYVQRSHRASSELDEPSLYRDENIVPLVKRILVQNRVQRQVDDPTLRSIPRFYKRKSSDAVDLSEKASIVAKNMFLGDIHETLPSAAELEAFRELLYENSSLPFPEGVEEAIDKIEREQARVDEQFEGEMLCMTTAFEALVREGEDHGDAKIGPETVKAVVSLERRLQYLVMRRKEISTVFSSPRINYEDFSMVLGQVPLSIIKLLTPDVFLQFHADHYGRVSCQQIMLYLSRMVSMVDCYTSLLFFASSKSGLITEAELEDYVTGMISIYRGLASVPESFIEYYACIATRTTLFYAGSWKAGRIRIKDLVLKGKFQDFAYLKAHDPTEEEEGSSPFLNPFSLYSTKLIYEQFLELDVDKNGLLDKDELINYGTESYLRKRGQPACKLTSTFIQRVFEELPASAAAAATMDFRGFVDFTLAMTNRNSPLALEYLFGILDVQKKGYLNTFDINFFFREIVATLKDTGTDGVDNQLLHDVKDEIFDMVRPKDPYKITLADLKDSKLGGTVISILIDVQGFWSHENRENLSS